MTIQPHHLSDGASASAGRAAPPAGCPAHAGALPLNAPSLGADPAAQYRRMRAEHGPVAPVRLDGDVPAWLVIGYAELYQITSDPDLFSRDSRHWNAWDRIPAVWPLLPLIGPRGESVLETVGEAHAKRAGVLSDALQAVDPHKLREYAEQFADQLIDTFCDSGATDLVAGYARRLPGLVLSRIFGFPDSEGPAIVAVVNAVTDDGPGAAVARQQLHRAMRRLIVAKRAAPGPDVASRMLAHPDSNTSKGIAQDLAATITTGHQPTADWIGNTLRLMLSDDRFAMSLSAGRRSVGQAMNEVLWEDTPTQNVIGRWATRGTELGGQLIRAGDLLLLGLAAANTDPRVRTASHNFTDRNNAFLSYGHGEHRCPYPAQEIAEVIATTAIEVLVDRLPDVDLAVPAQQLSWQPSCWRRSLSALPVRFTPAPEIGGESR